MALRVLVAGIGNPWVGDLDFGPRFARRCAQLEWPAGVLVEEAPWAAQIMLHRLMELEPERVVVVASYPRGGEPGAIRSYRLGGQPPDPDDVAARLGESATGVIDLEHVLRVARHFGVLPADSFVVEVEPGSLEFGDRFTDAVEASYEPVLALVRQLACP